MSDPLARYELVVGMEVHAQLDTRSKLFCACAVEFGAPVNARTCPVCLGLPGSLPVLNGAAVEAALRIAAALGCAVPEVCAFDRKNYFYPDLPKNYQITQLYRPIGGAGGALELLRSGSRVRIRDVHLEEDAGKLSHLPGAASVDFDRAGTPLAEIVTEPDMRSVDEVDDYMETLTELLRALEVSRCRMQEGNLRFEASVSVRPVGAEELGPRVEIKNLNSYAAVRKAVAYERARQVALLEAGRRPRQETRLWDEGWSPDAADARAAEGAFEEDVPLAVRAALADVLPLLPGSKDGWSGRTRSMRTKEEAHDYRYFPEPDLPAVRIDAARLEAVRAALPELPGARRRRYVEALGLAQAPAEVLTRDRALAAYFEQVVARGVPAAEAATLVLNQVAALLNARGVGAEDCPVPPEHTAELYAIVAGGELPKDLALKQVWPRMADEGRGPREVMTRHGIEAVAEEAVIAATDAAWAANPKAVTDLLAGKQKAAGAIVGAVMKATKGKASPEVVRRRVEDLLQREREAGRS